MNTSNYCICPIIQIFCIFESLTTEQVPVDRLNELFQPKLLLLTDNALYIVIFGS